MILSCYSPRFINGQVIVVFLDACHLAPSPVDLLSFVGVEGIQFLFLHSPWRLDGIDITLADNPKAVGQAFTCNYLFFLKVFPQLIFTYTYLTLERVRRQWLDVNLSCGRVKSLEIFLSVVTKKGGVFCNPVLDHFPRNARDIDFAFRKRIESSLVDFKSGPTLSVYLHFLRLNVGDIEIFLPGIVGLDLFDDIFQLSTRFMEVEGSLVLFRHVKRHHHIKAFPNKNHLFVYGKGKKGIIFHFYILRLLCPSAKEVIKRIIASPALALTCIRNSDRFARSVYCGTVDDH